MKKLFSIPLAGCLLLMGACSDKENSMDTPSLNGVVIELSAVNKLDDGFRAPLYSQEAVQSVEVVNVYVFQKQADPGTDYLWMQTIPITGWVKGSTFQRYEIATADDFPVGSYKFLAVGTDNASVNPYTITSMSSSTKFDDVMASIATASNQELEIFAGSKAASVTVTGGGMRVPIQMTRQVAGLLGYFKNVPAEIGGTTVKFLRLTMSNGNKAVNLTTGVGSSPIAANYNIFNVDLSTQSITDGIYNGNDLTAQGVVKLDKTQLNGAFLLPINGVTLTLGLYDTNGAPLKTWTVLDNLSASLNILPNNFYALGVKTQAGNTNGGGTGSTPDSPIDLLTDQSITLTILPNWAAFHNLVIQ